MKDLHLVTRSFYGAGVQRERDEVVDTSAWKHAKQLVRGRYLSVAPHDVEPVACECCDRRWKDEAARDRHVEAMTAPAKPAGNGNRRGRQAAGRNS